MIDCRCKSYVGNIIIVMFYRVNDQCISLHSLQRRRSLEEWMTKLLSDIEVSRCAAVASFLELEAAARACMHLPIASCIYCAQDM